MTEIATEPQLERRMSWPGRAAEDVEPLVSREWLVTNGLGGYASGTVSGVLTRRFHGLLIAALPAPFGRRMMLNSLNESLRPSSGERYSLGGEERMVGGVRDVRVEGAEYLSEFRLEMGMPVWTFKVESFTIEKRLVMPHQQNTVYITYTLLEGDGPVKLRLRPALQFRPHEGRLGEPFETPYILTSVENRFEFSSEANTPVLRMQILGAATAFTIERQAINDVLYRVEERRGYEAQGGLHSPGFFRATIDKGQPATLIASTEAWETISALSPAEVMRYEQERRLELIARAPQCAQEGLGAELVLAADQFVIKPAGRIEDATRAHAQGDEVRTVIAGYHWFTDWGRDTMISLEGLTLSTGRQREAAWILRTFAYYVRDGLIPNFFPDGKTSGVYHTADASLWFFQAMARYLAVSGDRSTLRMVLPKLTEIMDAHIHGTRFGIGMDPADGLLRQGAEGYQLTWMDAKVDDWVVTPRRGKAVEINALWYNALRLLATWLRSSHREAAERYDEIAEQAYASFQTRFWYEQGGYLYDVIDGEEGDDADCRPNQILSFSLTHPVLDETRWRPVLGVVRERLLTPVGLRSLSPGSPEYKPRYDGDLRSRDAAYHQGTVWGWLMGPYIDAYLRVHPQDKAGARALLAGVNPHLSEACLGTVSEVFDAEEPYTPRGCVAQAWSVAEALRCWVKTA